MITIVKVKEAEQQFIGIKIPVNEKESIETIKKIDGRRWHTNEKIWTIPYKTESYSKLKELFKDKIALAPDNEVIEINSIKKKPKTVVFESKVTLFDRLNPLQKDAVSKLEQLLYPKELEMRFAYTKI